MGTNTEEVPDHSNNSSNGDRPAREDPCYECGYIPKYYEDPRCLSCAWGNE